MRWGLGAAGLVSFVGPRRRHHGAGRSHRWDGPDWTAGGRCRRDPSHVVV